MFQVPTTKAKVRVRQEYHLTMQFLQTYFDIKIFISLPVRTASSRDILHLSLSIAFFVFWISQLHWARIEHCCRLLSCYLKTVISIALATQRQNLSCTTRILTASIMLYMLIVVSHHFLVIVVVRSSWWRINNSNNRDSLIWYGALSTFFNSLELSSTLFDAPLVYASSCLNHVLECLYSPTYRL